ncbi:thioesterase II family protein [Streptomyces albidoflavus]|uniref:thioesterase II family protein n=1 Tax=Streptomyces albidoflavus TaxID=1886 RepID=UPI00352E8A92|nr:alpha/beta fold hydrolase [Streptomyces albidoflavus]
MPTSALTRYTKPLAPTRRLVCFPHAGGAASFYRDWRRCAPPEVELIAVQYPGRENRVREPLVATMEELATALAEELLALPPLPTVFFGHSMGAAVAHETLLRVERSGATHVTRLCVSGRAPRRSPRTSARTDEEVVAAVLALGGTHATVFEDPELRELLLPIIANDYRLIDAYRPAAGTPLLRAAVHALTGADDPQITPEEAGQWRAVTSGRFALTVLDGDHFYLVPEAERVARAALDPELHVPV